MHTFVIKDIIDEDFTNYKKPSMFIATSICSFKCEKEDCNVNCHNSKIVNQTNIKLPIEKIIQRYLNNSLTSAVVIGGLEPFDQIDELLSFVQTFRKFSNDDIVIYTGYTELEINTFKYNDDSYLNNLIKMNKIISKSNEELPTLIIKYGRFKSSGDKIYDNVLGIELASGNQYAKIYK